MLKLTSEWDHSPRSPLSPSVSIDVVVATVYKDHDTRLLASDLSIQQIKSIYSNLHLLVEDFRLLPFSPLDVLSKQEKCEGVMLSAILRVARILATRLFSLIFDVNVIRRC